jgi:hypothetical protein
VSTSWQACAVLGALLIALGLAACGSSDSGATSNASATRPAGARRGFLQDPKVVACLKKAGVTVPSRPRGSDGGPPSGQNGQPPSGQNGRPKRRSVSPQFQKLRAALQKCGVTFQGRPPSGQPPPGGEGTTSTSAS